VPREEFMTESELLDHLLEPRQKRNAMIVELRDQGWTYASIAREVSRKGFPTIGQPRMRQIYEKAQRLRK
jgi:hypothetical protein